MARPKKITTEKLRQYLTQFISEHPSETVTPSSLSAYIRACGEDIADYLIRRDSAINDEIQKINADIMEKMLPAVAVFQPLDVDAFLTHNTTLAQLTEALTKRDCYYASVVKSMKSLVESNRTLLTVNKDLKAENGALNEQVEKKKVQIERLNKQLSDMTHTEADVQALLAIIKKKVNPEIANALLAKAGLIKLATDTPTVPPERLGEITISADTDVAQFTIDALSAFADGFGDDDD